MRIIGKTLASLIVAILLLGTFLAASANAEPAKVEGCVLVESTNAYDVYKNEVTKEYTFVGRNNLALWTDRSIPEQYRPKDPQIVALLQKEGRDITKYHIAMDYSSQHPETIIYKEVGSSNRVALFSTLPVVTMEGVRIDCAWTKTADGYISGANWFKATATGSKVQITVEGKNLEWNPQLFLDGVEQKSKKPTLLSIDPVNPTYQYNTLEWDYDGIKRRLRIIDGMLLERWFVERNPHGTVRIKHNHTGTVPLKLSGAIDNKGLVLNATVTDDEEIVPAEAFAKAEYPVIIFGTLTVYSTSSDDSIYASNLTYSTAHDAATGTVRGTGNYFRLMNYKDPLDTYYVERAFVFYDTSSLGSGAIISAATASFYGASGGGEADTAHTDLGIVQGVQDDPLQTNDFGDHLSYTTLGHDSYYDYSASWTTSGYNDVTLNSTGRGWINKTGTTKLCLRLKGDIDDSTPTGLNFLSIYANEKGSGYQPKLAVTYSVLPQVTTNAATNVEVTTATLNGNITSTGNATCDQRGFVWDTSSHGDPGNTAPVASGYANNWTEAGLFGTGTFSQGESGLNKGDVYYYRACSHNSVGWSYGSEETFLTKPDAPTGFTATAISGSQIDLSWTKGGGAQRTFIVRKTGSYPSSRSDGTQVYFDAGASYSNTSLASGTTYYYSAWSEVQGSQQWSNTAAQASATTTGAPPPPPAGVGGTIYPANKAIVLAPWIGLILALFLAIYSGISRLRRCRVHVGNKE